MNVLVIGDEHTYGYGLSGGNLSYIGHFIQQISRTGRAVSVEAYAHLTVSQTIAILEKLPLSRYDLIMLQLDDTLLQSATQWNGSADVAMPVIAGLAESLTQVNSPRFRSRIWSIGEALLSMIQPPRPLTAVSVLLDQLRPYRHNVLLLTPFPHLEPVSGWLRKRSRAVLMREAQRRLVSVFDTNSAVCAGEEYFLPNDTRHLNAVSHELLGRSLFDFYQSAPTIITVQAIRRP